MKHNISLFVTVGILLIFSKAAYGQAGKISLHQYCNAGYEYTWAINIHENKPVKLSYSIDIPINGNATFAIQEGLGYYPIYYTTGGYENGTITTSNTTGTAYVSVVVYQSGIVNIEVDYSAYNPGVTEDQIHIGANGYVGVGTLQPLQKLHVNGNSYITGNLGLGISNPQEKLHVNGAIRGNGPGQSLNIRTSYGNIEVGAQNQFYAHIYTDRDQFIFNKRVNLYNGVLTSYVGTNLNFQTGGGTTEGTTRMTILNSNGNVGVGTTNPISRLHVYVPNSSSPINAMTVDVASFSTTTNAGNSSFFRVRDIGGNTTPFIVKGNGNVGVGVVSPQSKLDVGGDVQLSGMLGYMLFDNFSYDNKTLGHYSIGWFSDSWTNAGATQWQSSFGGFKFFTGGMPRVSIKHNGYVGIGTTNPTDILSVNGTIRAKEVKIDLCEDLADYVFSPEYKLMPLFEVEKFVKTNRHLPEIPSAAEVKENGLSMGEMQNKLLQKIEELTLYVIEQQKRIEQLEKNQK